MVLLIYVVFWFIYGKFFFFHVVLLPYLELHSTTTFIRTNRLIFRLIASSRSQTPSSSSPVPWGYPGDEVVEWNGRSLHGRSAQEVNDIVTDIRNDFQSIELIISRPATSCSSSRSSNRRSNQHPPTWRNSHSPVRYTRGIFLLLLSISPTLPVAHTVRNRFQGATTEQIPHKTATQTLGHKHTPYTGTNPKGLFLLFVVTSVLSLCPCRCLYFPLWSSHTVCLYNNSVRCTSTESYERREKPSVLVTSPGSPDLHSTNRCSVGAGNNRYANRLAPVSGSGSATAYDPNIGGRIQVKLGFESSSLQLIVTLVCAAGLTQRSNGTLRNPYGKVRGLVISSLADH